jgi:hypothetical protein
MPAGGAPISSSLCLRCKRESGRRQGFSRDDVRRVLSRPLNAYLGTPEKDSRPIGAGFVRLLRVNQAGKRGDIKSARSQKHGLQMPSGALIADQAIKKL